VPILGTTASSTFKPDKISSLSFWLDASDSSTITQTSNQVSQWNDKSSKGYNVSQATSANMPLTNQSTKNGLNVIYFDGVNDLLVNTTNSLMNNINGYSAFVVVSDFTTSGVTSRIFQKDTASVGASWLSFRRLVANGKLWSLVTRRLSTDTAVTFESTTNANSNYNLQSSIGDFLTGVITLRVNKVQEATGTTTTGTTNSVTGAAISIGALVTPLQFANANIAEIVIYERTLSTQEIQNVENYLTSKWGL